MKKVVIVCITVLILSVDALAQPISVMPYPDSVAMGNGKYRINKDLVIQTSSNDINILKAVNRFYQALNRRTQAFFATEYIRPGMTGSFVVEPGQTTEPKPGIDESYTLQITEQSVRLTSANGIGTLHGLQTLLQLVEKDEQGSYLPAVTIYDKPRFTWRGLMIDVARHFIPMDVLKRNVDAMEAVKMNVLHIHLTDDEGFRIESKVYPKLHQLGSNGNYYTQEEMKSLVSYGRERGVMIFPEFDLPGHSKSWFAGYPELASTPGTYTPGPRFALDGTKSAGEAIAMINSTPTPTIDPTKEAVYQFLDKLAGEMKTIFPYGYFHLGADENNGIAWKQNPAIVDFMKKNKIADVKALEEYFIKRMYGVVSKHKYRMIVWEEGFFKDLPKDVIVQKWKPEVAMMGGAPLTANAILKQGNDLLISSGFYLDQHFPAHSYYLNPSVTGLKGIDTLKGRVLGGEAAQWTEIADGSTIETRVWMNAAAVAERLWSKPTVNNMDQMYVRLGKLSLLLDENGLGHISQYEKGLRRLTGSADISDVRSLTDVLTPVKGYKRLIGRMSKRGGMNVSTAPLVGVVDIIPVNSQKKRQFRQLVSAYLSTPSSESEKLIREQLQVWSSLKTWDDHGNPALKEIRPHAESLSELAAAALEALDLRAKGSIPADWIAGKQELIKKASMAKAETDLDVIPELEALITGKLKPEPVSYPLL